MTPGGSVHQGWEPMRRIDNDPRFEHNPDMPDELRGDEVWWSKRYQCVVRYMVPNAPEVTYETAGSEYRGACDRCDHWVRGDKQGAVEAEMAEHMRTAHAGREGMLHLSIHANDRGPMRNWRHMQQIKNEVAGELRTAIEIFPAEDELTDTSNEYHLWVLPDGVKLGYGLGTEPIVSDDQQVREFNEAEHKGRQEEWEPGLTTGRSHHSIDSRERMTELMDEGKARRS